VVKSRRKSCYIMFFHSGNQGGPGFEPIGVIIEAIPSTATYVPTCAFHITFAQILSRELWL